MNGLIAQAGTEAAEKGLTSLASGDYGVLGIILAIVLVILVVFGIFYIRSTQAALALKDAQAEARAKNYQLVIDEKDEIILAKDAEIKRLNEDRVTAAKTGTEAVIKATESVAGLLPAMQTITGQLQLLLQTRGGS